jgi:hypothetical protein
MSIEALSDQVHRAKARWLRRVMYDSLATSTQRCFAYVVADHLNCVTLDCWVGQLRVARLMRWQSIKTVQRAAANLARLELLALRRSGKGKGNWRYAPVFQPSDWDKPVRRKGQLCPDHMDTDVRESFLEIQLKSDSTAAEVEHTGKGRHQSRSFERAQRGGLEIKVAELLGPDGMQLLEILHTLDDQIVDRICGAYVEGRLGERELAAARLAAEQGR